jgi:DeoR/GlpR family transcriptional regulator of sugar metabolism
MSCTAGAWKGRDDADGRKGGLKQEIIANAQRKILLADSSNMAPTRCSTSLRYRFTDIITDSSSRSG